MSDLVKQCVAFGGHCWVEDPARTNIATTTYTCVQRCKHCGHTRCGEITPGRSDTEWAYPVNDK